MIFSLIIISSTVTILYQKIWTEWTDIEGFRNASTYSQAIVWDFVYNDIVVRVEAPVWAFPSWTELRITPITAKKQMAEIKDSLIENTDVTEESKAVSFDISFIYTMSDWEEVELQPNEWYKVKVAFNYIKDENFRQVDEKSDKELKVYHLEEVVNERGRKTDEVEVKEVEINEWESSEWELVVDAEKFSIYTIVDQIREETNNQLAEFKYDIITISWSNASQCITIMDRNLWATGNDISSGNSYGYYYQHGNNYGFTLDYLQDASHYSSTTISTSKNPSEYVSKTFITTWWWYTVNWNLWWWWSDMQNANKPVSSPSTNYTNRQWPCPDGWHVPSQQEWATLLRYFEIKNPAAVLSDDGYWPYFQQLTNANIFQQWAKIPNAGRIVYTSRAYASEWLTAGYLHSSSVYFWNKYTYPLKVGSTIAWMYRNNRLDISYAMPIRCFYNSTSCSNLPKPTIDDGENPCDLPWWWTAEDEESVTWYQAATVPYGQNCMWVQATCNNGDWSVNNFTLDYPYSWCIVADPVWCTFKWQPIAHEWSLVVYSTSSEFCPDTCTSWTITCNNGILEWDTWYTNLSCDLEPVWCDSSYNLSSTGANGTYSSCIPYTVNGNSCTPWTTLYKLDSCNSWYTQVWDTCKQNCTFNWQSIPHGSSVLAYSESLEMCPDECRFETRTCNDWQLSWSYTNTSCTVTPVSCSEDFYPFTTCPANGICTQSCIPYTVNNNSCTIWTVKYQLNWCEIGYHSEDLESCTWNTKQVQCIQWYKPSNSNYVPSLVWVSWQWTRNNWSWSAANDCTWVCNEHYHTWANNESCEIDKFNITRKNSDGSTLKIDTWVAYWSTPSYNWETPMSGWNAQYSYEFAGWSPEISQVTWNITYTAVYTKTIKNYTVLINSSNINSWTVSTSSITVPYWTNITTNSNILTIFNETITATSNPQTAQYTHQFVDWINTCGDIITTWCTIIANFSSTLRTYTVTWKNSDWSILETDTNIPYWTTPSYDWEVPTSWWDAQYSYTFAGWTPSISIVTWNITYIATYTQNVNKYTVTWKNSNWTILERDSNVEYWTTPRYDWETPTSGWDLQYSYQFIWWIPEISKVKWNTIYIAKYNPILPNAVSQDEYDKNPLDNLDENNEIETEKNLTWFVSNFFEEWIDLDESQLQIFNEVMHMWDSLNEQEISWQDIYKNIIVSVLAPIWSFPKGTELRIIPIKTKSQIQEIKEQLIENTDVTQESELVSFDISFIYTLSNGEEIELQPYTWQTVKVSFNYTYNDTLSEANSDSNKELKVYHLEEVKDEKGKKTDEVEVKEIEINNEESSDWELVVDVDKFSVYTLAAADGWLRAAAICTVTFQNGECYFWTQEKDGTCGFDMPAPIEVECWWTVSRQDIDEPYYTNTTSKYDETYNYNYYFTRWTTTLDPWYTSTNYNYNFNTPVTEDIILYAIWAYKSSQNWSNNANYTKTVTFNANGWTLTSTGSMLYGMYGLIKQPSDPIRAWYMLNCWSTRQTDTSCSYAYDFNSTTNTVTDDVDLYAQWSSLSYTIRFNANAWNGSINDINASYNNDYQLPSSWFSRNWYDLVWWNTESDWSGTGYDLWEVVRNITTTNGDIVTLYAQWGQMNRVTFEGNGWTVSVSYIDVVSGQVAEAPEEPTWSKHGFLGWYLTGSNSVFNFSTPITSDITLYAHWEELETVTVTFNSNWWSSVEPQEINPWERAVKPTNPTKNNQGFKYWTTDSAWNNEYDFKTPVIDDLILYAQWANICTVTFQNGYCYYNNSTNAQCTFSFTTTSVNVACGTPVERPEDPDSPITVTMGSRYNQQDRNMYFSKWSKTQNPWYNNTSNNYDFSTPVTSNLTLYAIWYVSYFTVTFNANGGMLNWSSSVTVWQYTRNNTVYWWYARRPEDPIRTWYDFKWWSTSNSTNWSEFDFNTTRITADTPLYALWTPITYTIKYNANGWAWNMANTDMTYGTAQNLRTNTFTKTNATFSGWNTKANESWTGYSNGESVNNLTDVAWRTINLYAQWNCNSGYHDDWGECVQDAQDCEFLWQTIADGSGLVVYSTSSPTCPTICTTWIVTCTNGVLWWDTWYTNLTCAPVSTSCDASFTLNSTGANGTYDSCTPYTANDNSCNAWTTVYKLTNCANGFHTEDNSSCTSDTKQVACIQNWKPEHSSYVAWNVNITWQWTWNNGSRSTADNCAWTCDPHYHTWANNNSCEIDTFQVTWLDWNGQTLKTDIVNYNVVPSYNGTTPTKTATAQYSYTFNNTWSPALVPAIADTTYAAQFNQIVNQYTATIVANPNGYGTVSHASVKKDYNSDIVVNWNKITIGWTEITATPTSSDTQYTYTFSGWINTCGNNGTKLIWDCTITAEFDRIKNKYLILFKNRDGSILRWDFIEYWEYPIYDWDDPEKEWNENYEYSFIWWNPEISPVTWDADYIATYETLHIPHARFVSPTPEDGSVRDRNRFTTKAEISNVDDFTLTYNFNDSGYIINNPMQIYNFDNMTQFWEVENEIVKDPLHLDNTWIIYGATWVSSGKYWGAYYFDWVDDYIELGQVLWHLRRRFTVTYRIKPEWWEWSFVINPSIWISYVNWIPVSGLPSELSLLDGTTIWRNQSESQYFNWLIDEIIVYSSILTTDDFAQFLYRSNLKKTSTGTWEFETINPCLDASWIYEYSIMVESPRVETSASMQRTLITNISWVSVEWTWYDFWIYETTGSSYVLSWTMWRLIVTDYLWKSWWKVYFTTSPTLVWQTTQETIDTNNLKFKATNLVYSWLYNWVSNTHVTFWNGISTDQYRTAHWNKETDNILEYIVRTEDTDDFMCWDVWTYSDNTQIQLDVPAWQVEDTYKWILWITLQEEINEWRSPVFNPINPGWDLKK